MMCLPEAFALRSTYVRGELDSCKMARAIAAGILTRGSASAISVPPGAGYWWCRVLCSTAGFWVLHFRDEKPVCVEQGPWREDPLGCRSHGATCLLGFTTEPAWTLEAAAVRACAAAATRCFRKSWAIPALTAWCKNYFQICLFGYWEVCFNVQEWPHAEACYRTFSMLLLPFWAPFQNPK